MDTDISEMKKYPEFLKTEFKLMDHWKCEVILTGQKLIDEVEQQIENTSHKMAISWMQKQLHKHFEEWFENKTPSQLGVFVKMEI